MSYFVVTLKLKRRGNETREVRKMESKNKAERRGFAPGTHTCAYHIWKPKGVSWGCTCSPPPAHQVNWEKTVFDCGGGGVDCPESIQPRAGEDRGVLYAMSRRDVANVWRTSAGRFLSVLRSARKGVAGRFLRVCEVVKSRQSCEMELQKSGGPECQN
jgi:hypothetical protein